MTISSGSLPPRPRPGPGIPGAGIDPANCNRGRAPRPATAGGSAQAAPRPGLPRPGLPHPGLRRLVPLSAGVLILALSACGGGSSSGSPSANGGPTQVQAGVPGTPISGGGTTGSYPYPWNRYFVQAYDKAKVLAVRMSQAFQNETVTYTLKDPNNPKYSSGQQVTSNALTDARLEYALSTGLTGTGQTVGIIDSAVNYHHLQFGGKTITLDGTPGSGDFHGTAVASVAVGNGTDGRMIGFAPKANLFAGYLDYNKPIDWNTLGRYMLDAQNLGVVAMNNSWGIQGATVANTDLKAAFSSGAPATYLADVRSYVNTGVVIFAAQNDYSATSIDAMAGLPSAFNDLQAHWLAVINAIPHWSNGQITSADRISAPCAEAARYCLAANGQTVVADSTTTNGYLIGSGASFAAPQVAGAMALLAEAFPDLTAQQLRNRLLVTADNSFYSHTGTATFAAGITHGYNSEFGMGFLDLQQALLPIGATAVPMSNGGAMPLGHAAIAGGFASGRAAAHALGAYRVLALDQMGGSFLGSASGIAAAGGAPDLNGFRLARIGRPDRVLSFARAVATGAAGGVLDHSGIMADPGAAFLMGQGRRTVYENDGFALSLIGSPDRTSGFAASQSFAVGRGALSLGVRAFGARGSVLGVTAPGFEQAIHSSTQAIDIGYARPLAPGLALRASAEFGTASGNGAGMIAGFSPLSYNRMSLALDRAGAFTRGDVLTLFVRRPVAITSGSAQMALPTSYSAGQPQFQTADIGLAPERRETDVGVDYALPLLGRGATRAALRLGLSYDMNAGNAPGVHAVSAAAGFSVRF